ncbi:hypothetical protein GGQ87_002676 [Brevundimonas alba]|uniref:YcxB-like C-terminal domain-containing protein n=1 Tax=Brevundimonas alba TaxID=74314 RepID=A0A7X6BQ94_9CAUL|nr:YcxB family protein [Brevundimonas alba]NJC42381.1 hypothetical protein [Brevundimonas alba]
MVRYAVRRDELWTWYWLAWKRTLWLYHVAIIAMVMTTFVLMEVGGAPGVAVVAGGFTSAALVGAMIMYPQLRYTPQERTLRFDEAGISYERGKQSGRLSWSRIRSVARAGDGITVTGRGQSAFIIPGRAFENTAVRDEALSTIAALQRGAD